MSITATSRYITPDGRKMNIQEITDNYKKVQRPPIIAAATIQSLKESKWSVNVKSSMRNIDLMELENHCQSFLVSKESFGLRVQQVSSALANASIIAEDEKAGSRVVLRTEQKEQNKSTFSVTWYRDGLLEKSVKLLDFDVHGAVVMKEPFIAFNLSHDGSRVLYIAEKKMPPAKSFFAKDRKPQDKEKVDSNPLGTEYLRKEYWGETLGDVCSTVICVLDLKEEKIEVIEKQDHSLMSPFWIANRNDEIGFIAINEQPKKLGLWYIVNRPTCLWKHSLKEKQSTMLAGEGGTLSIHSPVVNPAGTQVIFLQNAIGGAHMKASEIAIVDLNTKNKRVLCGLDSSLYLYSLPRSCWQRDGSAVFFSSQSRAAEVLWKVDVNTGSLVNIPSPLASAKFLVVDHNLAVITASSFINAPQVFACEVDSSTGLSSLNPEWVPVTESFEIKGIHVQSENVAENVQSFLVSPQHLAKEPSACILAIHGGPHMSYDDSFMPHFYFFTSLGFKILTINYRGSTGMNEQALNSLPGNIGTNDVADCMEATNFFINKGLIKTDELFLWGGSHGGFLACHLAGQFANFNWLALATRNPVVDISFLVQTTDFPDWCWLETFGDDSYFTRVVDEQVAAKMFSMSPFKHVSRVKTPSLILLGSEDLRVPMTAGLRWCEELKKAGVPTKCHTYSDSHSLSKVPVDADCLVNTVLWFMQHLEKKISGDHCNSGETQTSLTQS